MTTASKLFNDLNFVIVVEDESVPWVKTLCERLTSNAAKKYILHKNTPNNANLTSEKLIKQEMLSVFNEDIHVIVSKTADFWFYRVAAFDLLIPVVTPDWVEACISTNRITRASGFSPDPQQVLKGYQIYLSRHSFNTSEYAFYSALINILGGICIDYLSSRASHIVSTDPQDPAITAVANIKNLNIKYVLPTWIVQVFIERQCLEETGHLLSPDDHPADVKLQAQKLWEGVDGEGIIISDKFLRNHKFFLSLDLTLPSQCYKFFVNLIQAAGGQVARHIESSDIRKSAGDCFVGLSIDSEEHTQAIAEKLIIGNVAWVFYMWCCNSFVLPNEKLLLSPLRPRLFQKGELIVGYTAYLGQQRHYIQKLVEALGGVSTTEFTRKNTHLVTCFPSGQKYDAAMRWKDTCTVVNHLWLEDCYRLQRQVPCNDAKYTHIPVSGGLSTRLGQMPMEEHTCEDEDVTDTIIPNDILDNSPGQVSVTPGDSLCENAVDAPSDDSIQLQNHFDEAIGEAGCGKGTEDQVPQGSFLVQQQIDSALDENNDSNKNPGLAQGHSLPEKSIITNELTGDERLPHGSDTNIPHQDMSQLNKNDSLAPLETVLSKETSPDISSSPASQLLSSGNSRRAKEKAALKLHTDMEALNEFEENWKRKRNRSLLPEELHKLKQLKTIEDKVRELLENATYPEKIKGKKSKRPYDIVAVCTGCHEVINDLDLELLRMLGITILKTINAQCNCIIAPKKMRTAKFLTSLSCHPLKYALLPEFISSILSIFHGTTTSEGPLPDLRDFSIPELDFSVLEKTSLPTKVFQRAGITSINLTDDVPGGHEVLSSILKAHGVLQIKVLSKKFTEEDVVVNKSKRKSPTHILIAQKATQAKRFGKMFQNEGESKVLVVEWNWCVKSIFNLEADIEDPEFVVYNN
ncbi:LADA_0H19460g1_1 [Lachancea dasiensis]|uniref:LADA_0H19460g1_1 n=1 Tax=Lachancea dasiensis TaxID=1072105 RepID=A0A1G4K6A8_9SACH|nr:LADA_0H19460g1_1 [Lachancea dasiensis]